MSDEVIEQAYREKMNTIAVVLDKTFNGEAKGKDKKVGFVVLVFQYGDTSRRCNYISNGADRKDIVVLMKEMIARFEGQPEQSGRA